MEHEFQREDDGPFVGCAENIHDYTSTRLAFIKYHVNLNTIKDALLHLEHQPTRVALALFYPEYKTLETKKVNSFSIYDGHLFIIHYSSFLFVKDISRTCESQTYVSRLHVVSFVKMGEENMRKYLLAKTSHGDKFGCGYIKILVVMWFPSLLLVKNQYIHSEIL